MGMGLSGPCPFYSVLGMQPDLNVSHTQRGKRPRGISGICQAPAFSESASCFLFVRGHVQIQEAGDRAGGGPVLKLLDGREGHSAVGGEGTCVIRKQRWRVSGSIAHSCTHASEPVFSLPRTHSWERHTCIHASAMTRGPACLSSALDNYKIRKPRTLILRRHDGVVQRRAAEP